jgi:hypothetical protein
MWQNKHKRTKNAKGKTTLAHIQGLLFLHFLQFLGLFHSIIFLLLFHYYTFWYSFHSHFHFHSHFVASFTLFLNYYSFSYFRDFEFDGMVLKFIILFIYFKIVFLWGFSMFCTPIVCLMCYLSNWVWFYFHLGEMFNGLSFKFELYDVEYNDCMWLCVCVCY